MTRAEGKERGSWGGPGDPKKEGGRGWWREEWELVGFFVFLRPLPSHVEVPGLGIQLELWLPAYTTATATQDPSCICELHHSSQPCEILNPLSKSSD